MQPQATLERRGAFSERDFAELESFLRSTLAARRVEREEDAGVVQLRLYGKGDVLQNVLAIERTCLDRSEVADLRGYLARPDVKQRILGTGPQPFQIPSASIP